MLHGWKLSFENGAIVTPSAGASEAFVSHASGDGTLYLKIRNCHVRKIGIIEFFRAALGANHGYGMEAHVV